MPKAFTVTLNQSNQVVNVVQYSSVEEGQKAYEQLLETNSKILFILADSVSKVLREYPIGYTVFDDVDEAF